jgi:hypothetical protein
MPEGDPGGRSSRAGAGSLPLRSRRRGRRGGFAICGWTSRTRRRRSSGQSRPMVARRGSQTGCPTWARGEGLVSPAQSPTSSSCRRACFRPSASCRRSSSQVPCRACRLLLGRGRRRLNAVATSPISCAARSSRALAGREWPHRRLRGHPRAKAHELETEPPARVTARASNTPPWVRSPQLRLTVGCQQAQDLDVLHALHRRSSFGIPSWIVGSIG